MERFDAIIIGAGAAGMFCSALAGQAGRRVLLIDNGKNRAQNPYVWRWALQLYQPLCRTGRLSEPESAFCKSALARFTQWDFIDLVNKHGIARHEKTLGQLFCDDSAQQIVDMLVDECEKGNVTVRLRSEVLSVAKDDTGFTLELNGMTVGCEKLVIATGGLSMPGPARRRLVIRLPNNLASTCCRPARVWCHSLCINRCSKSYRCWRAWRCLP